MTTSQTPPPPETPATADGADDTTPVMSKRQIWTVLAGLMSAMLLAALDQTVVSTALYTIARGLAPGHGLGEVSWVVTAYLLAVTATMPFYGKISDLYGRRPVLFVAMTLFLAGSALCGIAPGLGALIAFRTLQGIGAGGLMTLVMAIIADMIPPRERGRYSGLGVAVMAVSSLLGPLAGGFFTQSHVFLGFTTSWRWAFWINVPIGIAALALVMKVLRLPPQPRRGHRMDFAGAGLLTGAVCAILLGTVWGGDRYAWDSAQIVGLGATAVVFLVAFQYVERRAAEPVFAPRLFRQRVFRLANPLLFIIGFANMGSVVYVTLYLQLADGLSPTSAGLHLMPMTFGMAIASITAGRLVSRLGRYKVFLVSGIVCAVTAMLLLADLHVGSPSWLVSLDILLLGLGLGQVMGIPALAVQNSVDRADMGAATSATTFTRSMGQAFGAAAFGAILTARLTVNLPGGTGALAGHGGTVDSGTLAKLPADLRDRVIEAYVTSYDTVFLVAAVVLALGLLLALRIPEVPLRGKAPLAPAKPLAQKPLGQG